MRLWFTILLIVGALFWGPACAGTLDRMEPPPAGWKGHVFAPDFTFPLRVAPEPETWDRISFRKEPKRYLAALLDYALAGQDRRHWDLRRNRVRHWYHVPWLGPGPNGREFIHGLTRARDFQPGELGPAQTACRQNWSLAIYNDTGGGTLRQMWGHGEHDPDFSALPFFAGTVAVKLVFTQATGQDDARLKGSPELQANVHKGTGDRACAKAVGSNGRSSARAPTTLRLIQFDIAVREARASYKTGWVFGSFRYDGSLPGRDPWRKLVPVGLMWGNDPHLGDEAVAAGDRPRQSIVFDKSSRLGRGGRMNGMVDERSSACASCHMAAQWPSVAPMTAPGRWREAKCWFRNLDARYPFGFPPELGGGCGDTKALKTFTSTDYSLQLAIALRNWSLEKTQTHPTAHTAIGTLRRIATDTLEVNGMTTLPLRR